MTNMCKMCSTSFSESGSVEVNREILGKIQESVNFKVINFCLHFPNKSMIFFVQQIELSGDSDVFICSNCSVELKACASILGTLKSFSPDWNQFPSELWLIVFGYLDYEALNAVHLVSRKFHGLANKFDHPLNLAEVTSLTRFKESNRIYKTVHGISRGRLDKSVFDFDLIAGESVKTLRLADCYPSLQQFYEILKMLPNLEVLDLGYFLTVEPKDADFAEFTMPKLKRLSLRLVGEKYYKVIKMMRCPAITEILCDFTIDNLMMDSHLATLKKLTLWNFGVEDYPVDFPALLRFLEAGNFESLNFEFRTGRLSFARFFKSQPKLKEFHLSSGRINDEDLKVLFNHCPDLEVLVLDVGSFETTESLEEIHKLKKLKSLVIDEFVENPDCRILRGLMVEVNPNLTELRLSNLFVAHRGATLEFVTELSHFVPNLKTLKMAVCQEEALEAIPTIFKKLQNNLCRAETEP
jgi:hypothetical protein